MVIGSVSKYVRTKDEEKRVGRYVNVNATRRRVQSANSITTPRRSTLWLFLLLLSFFFSLLPSSLFSLADFFDSINPLYFFFHHHFVWKINATQNLRLSTHRLLVQSSLANWIDRKKKIIAGLTQNMILVYLHVTVALMYSPAHGCRGIFEETFDLISIFLPFLCCWTREFFKFFDENQIFGVCV